MRATALLALPALAAALAAGAPPAAAQAGSSGEGAVPAAGEGPARTLCLGGAPRHACAAFLVVEMEGVLPLARTTRTVRWYGGYEAEETPFQDQLQWELGALINVGERWAVGPVVRLGPGSTTALTGASLRGRRWLTDEVGLDAAAGVTWLHGRGPHRWERSAGPVVDARLTFQDDVWAGVRWEGVALDAVAGPEETFDPGGAQHAVSLLLGLGSEWALGGSAALGAALLVLLATVDWS